MMLTKIDMFGGDGGGEIDIYYQWKGAYTKEQMSDEVAAGRGFPRRQPQALPHRRRSTRCYSEQGWRRHAG